MSTFSELENSHLLVFQVVENLNESDWEVPGACGEWSVKETVAHLASYERLIVDVLQTFSDHEVTPSVLRWVKSPSVFDATEIEAHRYATAQQIEDEYQDLQVQSTSLLSLLSDAQLQQKDTLPWYKPEYSLVAFLREMALHIRNHCAQISRFRQRGDAPFARTQESKE